jgi:hypothetical protein
MFAKRSFLSCAIASGWLLVLSPAAAQSPTDADKIERLQRRTELLEKELTALRREINETRKKPNNVEPVAAVPPTVTSTYIPSDYKPGPASQPLPSVQGVKVTFGGFIAAESVFRTRNQVADMGSTFNAIPYPFSPLYAEQEFHASARGSRLSLLAEGNIDKAQSLAA